MKVFLTACLLVSVECRPQKADGFNPGEMDNINFPGDGNSGFNSGNNNPGFHIPDFVPDESITNPGGRGGMSGFNPGESSSHEGGNRPDSDSVNNGFNPGYSGGSGSGFNPGFGEDSGSNSDSGFNPGYSGGSDSGFNPGFGGDSGSNSDSGFNPGYSGGSGIGGDSESESNSGFNPGSNHGSGGFNPGSKPGSAPGANGFRTPIIFAEDEDVSDKKSPLPPYKPGGDKRPYLRGNNMQEDDEGDKDEEEEPKYFLLQKLPFNPLIGVQESGFISAQTLPNPIQFAETPSLAPYVPGSNKQQYLRGRGKQTKPFDASTQEDDEPRVVPLIAYNPLIKTSEGNFISAQTLPNQIQFAEAQVLGPYVPGSNKQQYLRGRGKQTKPFDASAQQVDEPRYLPLIAYNPLIKTSDGDFIQAQTLPTQIQFAEAPALGPYVPGSNKQQYLRGRGKQTKPFESEARPKVLPATFGIDIETFPARIPANSIRPNIPSDDLQQVQTLPSPIAFAPRQMKPYTPGTNKQQYLRAGNKQILPFLPRDNSQVFVPLIQVRNQENIAAQTLPSQIVFAQDAKQTKPINNVDQYSQYYQQAQTLPSPASVAVPYVSGTNKQPYLRDTIGAVAIPAEVGYVPGGNKQQYLRNGGFGMGEEVVTYPEVSARPRFPPGYYPSTRNNLAFEDNQAPRNILYFF